MTRLFVAAWPPREVAARWSVHLAEMLRSGDDAEPGVRPVPADNLHVTLRFLGDVDADEAVAALSERVLPVAAAHVRSPVVRLGSNLLVIPVAGVDALAHAVRDATRDLGRPPENDFFGHLTVARTKKSARSLIEGAAFDAAFPVDEIRLVESRLDPAGAVYSTIRSFRTG